MTDLIKREEVLKILRTSRDKTDIWDNERWDKFERMFRKELKQLPSQNHSSLETKPSNSVEFSTPDNGTKLEDTNIHSRERDRTTTPDNILCKNCALILNKHYKIYSDYWCFDEHESIRLTTKFEPQEEVK